MLIAHAEGCIYFIKLTHTVPQVQSSPMSSSYWRTIWDGPTCPGTTKISGNIMVSRTHFLSKSLILKLNFQIEFIWTGLSVSMYVFLCVPELIQLNECNFDIQTVFHFLCPSPMKLELHLIVCLNWNSAD